jgi:prepilin-type processing-associated H-X9-DG protein/prepilin-type N-terminal cleavage/methylation domain-containing protein
VRERSERSGKNPRAAFTLVELLVVMAILGLLAAILIGALPAALEMAQGAACRSNLRQLAAANLAYAADYGRFVAAAADIASNNTVRWHGVRVGKVFDSSKGPLTPYLGGTGSSAGIRRCPGFRPETAGGFEVSCGGYGYNEVGVGSELCLPGNGVKTEFGMHPGAIEHPAETVMFTDAAFLSGGGKNAKLIEYSFCEPPQSVSGGIPPWPSIHFRHRGRANVAWCDGHVSAENMERTDARSTGHALGWFGPDDNSLFDPF